MKANSYLKKDVASMTYLPPRLVQYYVDEGVISPEIYRGRRRGDHHHFSQRNVFEYAVIKELVGFGIGLATIKAVMPSVHDLDAENEADLDYPKRLRALRPYLRIYKSTLPRKPFQRSDLASQDITIELYHVKALKGAQVTPIVTKKDLEDTASMVVIDLWSLFSKIVWG